MDELSERLRRFEGLYHAEDWVWSALRPVPRAGSRPGTHGCSRTSLLGMASTYGRDDRRGEAGHDRMLRASGLLSAGLQA